MFNYKQIVALAFVAVVASLATVEAQPLVGEILEPLPIVGPMLSNLVPL